MGTTILYTTTAKATGGRDGRVSTGDGALDLGLSTPRELGGMGEPGANPEQLFAAGYAACFLSAMKYVSTQGAPSVPADATVSASVGIGPNDSGGFGLDVGLDVTLPGMSAEDAKELVDRAHAVCPYSNATRDNVPVQLRVV